MPGNATSVLVGAELEVVEATVCVYNVVVDGATGDVWLVVLPNPHIPVPLYPQT